VRARTPACIQRFDAAENTCRHGYEVLFRSSKEATVCSSAYFEDLFRWRLRWPPVDTVDFLRPRHAWQVDRAWIGINPSKARRPTSGG
jgi:hypothetical protein